jgi:hypothetical protein
MPCARPERAAGLNHPHRHLNPHQASRRTECAARLFPGRAFIDRSASRRSYGGEAPKRGANRAGAFRGRVSVRVFRLKGEERDCGRLDCRHRRHRSGSDCRCPRRAVRLTPRRPTKASAPYVVRGARLRECSAMHPEAYVGPRACSYRSNVCKSNATSRTSSTFVGVDRIVWTATSAAFAAGNPNAPVEMAGNEIEATPISSASSRERR